MEAEGSGEGSASRPPGAGIPLQESAAEPSRRQQSGDNNTPLNSAEGSASRTLGAGMPPHEPAAGPPKRRRSGSVVTESNSPKRANIEPTLPELLQPGSSIWVTQMIIAFMAAHEYLNSSEEVLTDKELEHLGSRNLLDLIAGQLLEFGEASLGGKWTRIYAAHSTAQLPMIIMPIRLQRKYKQAAYDVECELEYELPQARATSSGVGNYPSSTAMAKPEGFKHEVPVKQEQMEWIEESDQAKEGKERYVELPEEGDNSHRTVKYVPRGSALPHYRDFAEKPEDRMAPNEYQIVRKAHSRPKFPNPTVDSKIYYGTPPVSGSNAIPLGTATSSALPEASSSTPMGTATSSTPPTVAVSAPVWPNKRKYFINPALKAVPGDLPGIECPIDRLRHNHDKDLFWPPALALRRHISRIKFPQMVLRQPVMDRIVVAKLTQSFDAVCESKISEWSQTETMAVCQCGAERETLTDINTISEGACVRCEGATFFCRRCSCPVIAANYQAANSPTDEEVHEIACPVCVQEPIVCIKCEDETPIHIYGPLHPCKCGVYPRNTFCQDCCHKRIEGSQPCGKCKGARTCHACRQKYHGVACTTAKCGIWYTGCLNCSSEKKGIECLRCYWRSFECEGCKGPLDSDRCLYCKQFSHCFQLFSALVTRPRCPTQECMDAPGDVRRLSGLTCHWCLRTLFPCPNHPDTYCRLNDKGEATCTVIGCLFQLLHCLYCYAFTLGGICLICQFNQEEFSREFNNLLVEKWFTTQIQREGGNTPLPLSPRQSHNDQIRKTKEALLDGRMRFEAAFFKLHEGDGKFHKRSDPCLIAVPSWLTATSIAMAVISP
eukprot:GHVU01207021.1.p1 GENE.GHVU01207021.1~~GHVU01207021.1.p1  ORF type:complete len:865 (+),score=44.24 GHVU01207021.1:98-2596(+)